MADLGCFGQSCVFGRFWTKVSGKCPGGVREVSERCPRGVRDVSGGGKREKFQEFGRTTPKMAFSKKRQKKRIFAFRCPNKTPETPKTGFLGFRPLKKKPRSTKKLVLCFCPAEVPRNTRKLDFFLHLPRHNPRKDFCTFTIKKAPEATQMEFSRSCSSRATKRKKNLTLSLQSSRNTKTWILMLSPRLQPHKTPNRKNYKSLVEQLQTWLRKTRKTNEKRFLPFLCPKNAINAFGVRNSKLDSVVLPCKHAQKHPKT